MSRIRVCVGNRSGRRAGGLIAVAMLAAAAVVMSAGRVAADWVDTFPGGVPQQTWLTDSLPGFSQYTQSFFPGGQQLASNVDVFDGGAQIAYAYVNEFFDGSLGVRVRSVINPSPQVPAMTHTGVLAYLNPFTTSAYAVGVTWTSPASGERFIEINRASFGGIQFQGGSPIPNFNPNLSYIIEAEVSPINELGNQVVTARLYDMQETLVTEYSDVLRQNPPPDDPTAASPLPAGRSGVFAWRSDSGSDAALLGRSGTTSSSLPSPDLVWGGNTNLTIPHNDGLIPQGGSGTWQSSQANWLYANAPTYWNSARKAIFRGTPGTVTVEAAGATASGGLDFAGNGFVVQGGSITLGGTTANAVSVASGVSARIESPLAGTAGLQKVGGGTLVLAGTSTLSGALSVQAGRLTVDGSLAGTQVTVSGGVLEGSGSLGGLTVTGGGTVSPGASPGTLTVSGNVTLGSGGNYNWQVYDATGTAGSATGWDLLSVGGVLDVAATSADRFNLNLWSLSGVGPDVNGPAINWNATQASTWTIASAAGGITGFDAGKFTINTAATNNTAGFANDLAGGSFSVAVSGNNLNLVFTPGSGPSGIVIDVPSGSQTQAQAGYPTIATATSVSKIGAGTVVFDAANAYTGPTTVSAGTLQVANANALAATNVTVDTGATLAVASGTTMKAPSVIVDGGTLSAAALAVNGSTGIASLAINAGTVAGSPVVTIGAGGQMSLVQDARVTAAVGGLSVAETSGGGRLDLGVGQVTVAAGGISAADLRADIIAGRNGGAWNGASGIMSSTAAGAPAGTRAVGYVVAGDGSARVSFAAPGDSDLSGQVNVFDLLAIDSAGRFGTGQPAVWNQGDFNYDGVANIFDLLAIDSSGVYGTGNYFPAAPSALAVTAVPEPAAGWAAAILGLMTAAGLAGRSRGRHPLVRR